MATSGKEYKLAIRIAGSIDKTFNSSLVSAKSNLTNWSNGFATANNVANSFMTGIKKTALVAAGATALAATAAVKAGKNIISAGAENESAFAGVRKTVKMTEDEYAELSKALWDMSEDIPPAYKELAFVAETAGQLGIASEDVESFTKTMAILGMVSNDMEAADAATTFAKFANIVKMAGGVDQNGISNWERLGSTILTLGNNFATTEGQISEMALAMAAQASMVGFSEDEILAYATAMSSVGISANVGGNNLSKILSKIQLAVETNSEELGDWASVAHMSAEEFATAFKQDAAGTMATWIQGLSEGEGSATALLDELGITELRTTRLLKSLTQNSGGLWDALRLASQAWDENNGIVEYSADKLNAITSKMSEVENSFGRVKDTIYQQARPYIGDALDWIKEKLGGVNEYLGGSTGLSSFIDGVIEQFPTLKRQAETYLTPVKELFSGLFGFVTDNPELIISTIAGIAGAIGFIKIGNGVTSGLIALKDFINGLQAGNPASIIGAISLGIGAITAAIAYIAQIDAENKARNLAEHFGNITLSMSDLEEVAQHIVDSNVLSSVKEQLSSYSELSNISTSIDQAVKTINKTQWKVNVGMSLSDGDKQKYQQSIAQFVDGMNEYASTQRYTVKLQFSSIFGKNSTTTQKTDALYEAWATDMYDLGNQLSDAVNQAFADGVLDAEEVNNIANIEAKMAEIKNKFAAATEEASYSILISDFFNTGDLSSDSFQNLMGILSEQVANAQEQINQAEVYALANLMVGKDNGLYSDNEYEASYAQIIDYYTGEKVAAAERAAQALIEGVQSAYSGDISDIISYLTTDTSWIMPFDSLEGFQEQLENQVLTMMDKKGITNVLSDIFQGIDEINGGDSLMTVIANSVSEAFSSGAFDNIIPGLSESLNSAMQADETAMSGVGEAITESVAQGVTDSASNITDAITESFGSEEAAAAAGEALEATAGTGIEQIASEGNIAAANAEAQEILNEVTSTLNTTIDAAVTANITVNPGVINTTGLLWAVTNAITSMSTIATKLPTKHAEGGLVTSKELSWIGENGPEMVIPLDGSRSAQMLYEQTGKLMGMNSRFANGDGLDYAGGAQITYAPVLNFNGDAPSKHDIVDALKISQDEFDDMMESYMRRRARVSFG